MDKKNSLFFWMELRREKINMYFLIIVALAAIFAFVSCRMGISVSGNMGKNIGNKHLKDDWGIEEDEK